MKQECIRMNSILEHLISQYRNMQKNKIKITNFTQRFVTIFLIIAIVVALSGIGLLVQPKPADAQWDWTLERAERLWNNVVKNIHEFVIFPIIVTTVLKLADLASDAPAYLSSGTDFGLMILDYALAEAIMTILGINICGNLSINLKLVLFDYAYPTKWPECSLTQALENFKDMADSGFENFGIALSTGGDPGVYFETYGTMLDEKKRHQEGLFSRLEAGQGFLGLTSCPEGTSNPNVCKEFLPGSIIQNIVSTMYVQPLARIYDPKVDWPERYMALPLLALSILAMSAFNKGIAYILKKTFEKRAKMNEEKSGRE